MKRSRSLLLVLMVALCLLGQRVTVCAAITWTGDIDPLDPTTWTTSTDGCIGKTADGSLIVSSGDDLYSHCGYIAYDSGVTGEVTVTGASSTWTNGGNLYVGHYGSGTLAISDGGDVTASSVSINSQSLLTIDVMGGSRLTIDNGSGEITNNGTVRLVAGASPLPGATYTPISATTGTGSGICQALGGTWDETAHEFTVSEVEHGAAGTPVTIDPADKNRVIIDYATNGWSVGASFLAAKSSTGLTFEAEIPTFMPEELATFLAVNWGRWHEAFGNWGFSASGDYSPGDPVCLSFEVGAGYSLDRLDVFRYCDTYWDWCDSTNLTYDGKYVSLIECGLSDCFLILGMWIPGDTNGDNMVDATDAATLAAHCGETGAGWFDGDFNHDGIVNDIDATLLATNYSGTTTRVVPEPRSIVLALAGLICLLAWRRRY